jgi:hypothetical protein
MVSRRDFTNQYRAAHAGRESARFPGQRLRDGSWESIKGINDHQNEMVFQVLD